jgi:hypothetical protein
MSPDDARATVLAVVEAIVQRCLHVEALARSAYMSEHHDWQVGSGFCGTTRRCT